MIPLLFKWLIALIFIFAGIMHFLRPAIFFKIMPPWIPQPRFMVYVSRFFEILPGKRSFSFRQIKVLYRKLGMPAEVLIQEAEPVT